MSRSSSSNPIPTDTHITVKGHRLRVAIRPGDGTRIPLLLMNGIGANLELLQPIVDALDLAIEVVRFDAPGAGASPAPILPYRPAILAYLVAEMLDQLGYDQVDVLGISWGGALAQQFAVQHSHRCRRLVLVSTATGALMVPGQPAALLKLATPRRYLDRSYMERIAPDLYGGTVRSNPDLVRELTQHLRPVGWRGYLYQLLAGFGWTSLPWLPFIKQPTLILAGDDDPIIPLANGQILQRLIPHARLHVFQGGHLELVTQAAQLVPIVARFLSEEAQPTHSGRSSSRAGRIGQWISKTLNIILTPLRQRRIL